MAEASQAIHVNSVIDERKIGALQIVVIILSAAVVFMDGVDLVAIGLAAPPMAKELSLTSNNIGLTFGLGEAGVMIGAITFGPLADRLGRRLMVILSVLLFGLFTLATARAGSAEQLYLYRFIAGLGLGGAGPNAVALTADFMPRRIRRSFVTALWAGLPLGAAAVGLSSSVLIPHFGWRSLFYAAGSASLLLGVILVVVLPESVSFLVLRGGSTDKIVSILRRIAPDLAISPGAPIVVDEEKHKGMPVKHLFVERRAATTLLLWAPFFASFFVLTFVAQWVPSLLRSGGLSLSEIGFAITLNSLGSVVGCLFIGRLMDRFGAYTVLLITFIVAAITTGLLGFSVSTLAEVSIVITLAGCFAGASQSGAIALAAVLYPVDIRSTGVGWAMAAGRLGSVVAPIVGGVLLTMGWPVHSILLVIAAVVAVGAVFVALLKGPAEAHAARLVKSELPTG